MKIKKIFASILTFSLLISSLPLYSFANGVIQIEGNVPSYLGKNVNLASWINSTSPTFNGVPSRVPGDEAFYSSRGEIKLNINDQNRSYFENGGSVNVYVKKANNKFHFNPLNWSNFLSYKPENGTNSFKINCPDLSKVESIESTILFHLDLFKHPTIFSLISLLIFYFKTFNSALSFAGISLLFTIAKKILTNIAPLNNLLNNIKENKIDFDYGIVLTDEKDEFTLNPDLPKVGEINQKALKNWKNENDKNKQILANNGVKNKDSYSLVGIPFGVSKIPKECYYTQIDIDKMKKEKEEHKDIIYSKLAHTSPINDGFVCKLDKDHPSQTFRLVVNNQFPNNPNNADLFALALQNNNINLVQTDSKVNFVAVYNALSSETELNKRLSNVPLETQQKVNLLTSVGEPGFLSKAINWILDLFKNNISLSNSPNVPAGAAAVRPPAGGAAPAGIPVVTGVYNSRNMDYLRKATELYNRQPSNTNANYLERVNAVLNTNEHLPDNIAQCIDTGYNALHPPIQPAPILKRGGNLNPVNWNWHNINPRNWHWL